MAIVKILFSVNVFLAWISSCFSEIDVPLMTKHYCVLGAGPAGLQMAYFLETAQRDYILFEQFDGAGSFFKRYPRHRKLISTNNRTTGSSNKEFNLRFDLNSLISDDDSLLFTKYSEEYFPTADDLIEYLRDYQKKLNLTVQFNTNISDIQYHQNAKTANCRYKMRDQDQNLYCCRTIFIGTGWQKEKIPESLKGKEYVETYEFMSVDPDYYKDQTVLIIGRGFSGIETALALDGVASDIHLASANPIRLNWEAQYLGDVRGGKKELLNSNMLRDIEGLFEIDVDKIRFKKRSNGKIQLVPITDETSYNSHRLEGYDHVILCLGFQWSQRIFHESMQMPSFDNAWIPKNTYPDLGYDYQSRHYPGLYFIGPLTHSLDYRKSAGGFIHGFRNTIRALHRLVEWRNHGIKWPSISKPVDQLASTFLKRANEASGIYHMFSHLCDLAIYDSTTKKAIYLEELPVSFIPHILKNTGHEFNSVKHSAFILTFQYGADFSQSGVDQLRGSQTHKHLRDAKLANVLHPVIYYYHYRLPTAKEMESMQMDETLPKPTAVHHILQDLTTEVDGPTAHIVLLKRFVGQLVNEDLISSDPESCVAYALTQKGTDQSDLPASCRNIDAKFNSALLFH